MLKDLLSFQLLCIELYLVGMRHILFYDITIDGGTLDTKRRRKKKVTKDKKDNLSAVKDYLNNILEKE